MSVQLNLFSRARSGRPFCPGLTHNYPRPQNTDEDQSPKPGRARASFLPGKISAAAILEPEPDFKADPAAHRDFARRVLAAVGQALIEEGKL